MNTRIFFLSIIFMFSLGLQAQSEAEQRLKEISQIIDIESRHEAIAKLMDEYPEYAMAYYAWGHAYFKAKAYDSAMVYIQKALDLPDPKPGYHIAMANCLKSKGADEKALLQYQAALDLDPAYYPAILERSQYYLDQGSTPELSEALETLLAWEGEMSLLYFIRGTQKMKMGDFKGMQADMKKIIELEDKQMQVYDRLAIWTEEKGMLNYPEERLEWQEMNSQLVQAAKMMAMLPSEVTNQMNARVESDELTLDKFGPYNESLSGEKVSIQEINRLTQVGLKQFRAGNLKEALVEFEKVLHYYPQHKEALKYQQEIKALLD